MRYPHRTHRSAALVAAVCLITVSCASAAADRHEPAAAPAERTYDPKAEALAEAAAAISPVHVLAGDGTGPTSIQAREQITQTRVADCMHRQGWHFEAPQATTAIEATPQGATEFAATYGYGLTIRQHLDRDATGVAAYESNIAALDTLPDDDKARWVGAAQECDTTVRGQVERYFPAHNPRLAPELDAARLEVLTGDTYRDATNAWSECMTAAGHPFDTPADARNHFSDRFLAGEATEADQAEERQVAMADATCAANTIWPAQSAAEYRLVAEIVDRADPVTVCGAPCVPE